MNELTGASRSGTLTVAGTATEPSGNAPVNAYPGVTSVAVNGQNATVIELDTRGYKNFCVSGQEQLRG